MAINPKKQHDSIHAKRPVYVEVQGDNMSQEETWGFIEALDLESAV